VDGTWPDLFAKPKNAIRAWRPGVLMKNLRMSRREAPADSS